MKNILFISYDGMTDPLGQSQVIPYLVGLTKYGYRFTILSCEKRKKYELHKKYITGLLALSSITWVPITYHKNPPVLSTLYDVYQLRKKVRQLHSKEKFDMVHTRPGVPALIGLWMKKKWGVKFLNDIREFYADSRIDGGMWSKNIFFYKIIYNFFKRKEDEAVAKSDGIVCLTYTAERIIKQWPVYNPQTPLEVIPCSVDMSLFDPEKIDTNLKLKLSEELGIRENDFIVSYLGSVGGWYLTDEKMQFCKILSEKIPSVKFLFISPHLHKEIVETAKRFGISESSILVKHGMRDEIPTLLSFSRYSVFFIKPCYSKKSSSPTKHGEIMAMGIPVVTNAGVGDVAEIVTKYHSGIMLEDLSEKEFETAAGLIADGICFDRKAIREGAKEYYNLEHAIDKYQKIYILTLGGNRNQR